MIDSQFNRGWWSGFDAVADVLLTLQRSSSPDDEDLKQVLRDAGCSAHEIEYYLEDPTFNFTDRVRTWLEHYVSELDKPKNK